MRKLEILDNLIRINRYAGNPLIKSESVSDHTWCMMSLAIEYIPQLNKRLNSQVFDLKTIIFYIALHDIDECTYTDIPRPFKHHNEYIEKAIKETADHILLESVGRDMYKMIKIAEDTTELDGYIVKVFDLIQAGFKMVSEIKFGNEFFKTEINNISSALTDYKDYVFSFYLSDEHKFIIKNFIDEFITYFNQFRK